jgi:hypothetical protein
MWRITILGAVVFFVGHAIIILAPAIRDLLQG